MIDTKKDLVSLLQTGIYTVTFRKVSDENIRIMRCTLNGKYLPKQETDVKVITEHENTRNDNLVRVFDVDNDGWRSFRMDRVVSIQ